MQPIKKLNQTAAPIAKLPAPLQALQTKWKAALDNPQATAAEKKAARDAYVGQRAKFAAAKYK